MYYTSHYVIDWDKVETLEDMKLLISAMEISFEPDSPNLGTILHLVRQEEKKGHLFFNTTDANIETS